MLARREMNELVPEEREESEHQVDEVKPEEDMSKLGEVFRSEDGIRLLPWKETKAPIQAVIRENLKEVLSKSIVFLEVSEIQNSTIANAGCLDDQRAEVPWTKSTDVMPSKTNLSSVAL